MTNASAESGLVLLDDAAGGPVVARWAGHLLGLGARLARRSGRQGSQLVVAVSVPVRDYAAALIGAGWILAQPRLPTTEVLAEAERIAPHTPVRMATASRLVADRFYGVDRAHNIPRIHVGNSFWIVDVVDYIAADPDLPDDRFDKVNATRPGSLLQKTGRQATWSADQCMARPTVAFVGTRSRLEPELALQVGWTGYPPSYDRLRDILRPDDGRSPFRASVIVPGGRDYLPELPPQTLLAVLDGATAIRWLPELSTPLVVALIDRSSTDESAGIAVLQRRSLGQPVHLDALRWQPLCGMEALAFEVRV